MSWFKALLQLQKLNKHMAKNPKLKRHFGEYLKEYLGTDNEKEQLTKIQQNPDLINGIVEHYKEVKNEYKK